MIFQIDNVTTMDAEFRQKMLTLRKQVFCDTLLWDIPHCDGLEADIFDFTSAFYMNWIDESEGQLLGSVRLMPMTQNNLLNTVFRNTVEAEHLMQIENDPTIWEGARLCINEAFVQNRFGKEGLYHLLYGLLMSCEAIGIRTLVCNCDSLMYRRYRQLGLDLMHLGKTKQFRHGAVHCLSFEISMQNKMVLNELCNGAYHCKTSPVVGAAIPFAYQIVASSAPVKLTVLSGCCQTNSNSSLNALQV